MENKLELKHLAPYLPYGLTGLWENGKNRIYKVTNVCVCGEGNISLGHSLKTRYKHELNRPLSEFMPLLIPLSELKNYPDDEYRDVKYSVATTDCIEDIPHWVWEILLEHHFDLYGLLEAGLALNKLEHGK